LGEWGEGFTLGDTSGSTSHPTRGHSACEDG
jgi:hypothetical protein